MVTRSKYSISKPKFFSFIVHETLVLPEPKSYKLSLKVPKWKQVVLLDFYTLLANGTWDLLSLPSKKMTIGCKWVFRIKFKVDRTLYKYKVRLVAKSFLWIKGVYKFETFSLVVKLITIIIILTLALSKGWYWDKLMWRTNHWMVSLMRMFIWTNDLILSKVLIDLQA